MRAAPVSIQDAHMVRLSQSCEFYAMFLLTVCGSAPSIPRQKPANLLLLELCLMKLGSLKWPQWYFFNSSNLSLLKLYNFNHLPHLLIYGSWLQLESKNWNLVTALRGAALAPIWVLYVQEEEPKCGHKLAFCFANLVFYLQIRKYYFKKYMGYSVYILGVILLSFFQFSHFYSFKNHKISRVRGPCRENNCSLFPIAIFFLIPCFLISNKWSLFFSSFGSCYSRNFLWLHREFKLKHSRIYVVFN